MQAQDTTPESGFSAAAFAHYAQRFPFVDPKRDVIHCAERPMRGLEVFFEMVDAEQFVSFHIHYLPSPFCS